MSQGMRGHSLRDPCEECVVFDETFDGLCSDMSGLALPVVQAEKEPFIMSDNISC